MPLILMKIFEGRPSRFDRWMGFLTANRLQLIRNEISLAVKSGSETLEVGCGTGALAEQLAQRGCHVVAIDVSDKMLDVALQRTAGAMNASRLEFRRLSALEIEDAFPGGRFDTIVSVLTLSELSSSEVDCVLDQCHSLLRPRGELLVVDESDPENLLLRFCFKIIRYPVRLFV